MIVLLIAAILFIGCGWGVFLGEGETTLPPVVRVSATTDLELVINGSGRIVDTKTTVERKLIYADNVIRGLNQNVDNDEFLFNVPLVDSLYNKYFYRQIILTNGTIDTVSPGGLSRLQHQKQPGLKRTFDRVKITIDESNITQVWLDILDTAAGDSLKNDIYEETLAVNRFYWGRRGSRAFIPLLFQNVNVSLVDSLRAVLDEDTTEYGIDPFYLRDSLMVCGQPLRTLTWTDLNSCVVGHAKLKAQIQQRLSSAGIPFSTSVWVTLRDHRRKIRMGFMRHPVFRKNVKKWIKRQLK